MIQTKTIKRVRIWEVNYHAGFLNIQLANDANSFVRVEDKPTSVQHATFSDFC